MQALILAGGKGTRLRPLTVYTPKPIVPVLNRPMLLYQIEVLARAGIKDIKLSLSYQPDKIEDVLGDGSDFGVNLQFITESSPMGTGGAYKFAADGSKETMVVFNGDVLTDIDIAELIKFHKEQKSDATIVLAPVENPSEYGLVETDGDGKVLCFVEKPSAEDCAGTAANTINAGIYVLEPSILKLIPDGESTSFEYNVFPEILKRGIGFYGFNLGKHYWRDVGTPSSYLAAHRDFLRGAIETIEPAITHSDIATKAFVDKHSVIGEGCVIKPNARIVNSVLGPGVHIDERSVVENSVIWAHTRVSAIAEVRGAVVGRSCYIGRNVTVSEGSVLGDKASLPDYSTV